ncbi:diguanylate cyclase [Rhizobium sp. Root274]|uniref:bifunctional diguanylate cyclase/phosphodiesterase n=1 Tax=unclassified Rhizobium TaxID=2613769 RepID=UPI000713CD5D|nr:MULTISPECIES: EAL domain-containing protein [unclassified Rhizobium]KQW29400.1 diguanylate cyclase [Rhizobium sp. Root1240]KRD29592.1 diguanylate cyclase [Rhizobium sp. Root274]
MRLLGVKNRLKLLANRRMAVTGMLLVFAMLAVMVTLIVLTALDRVASNANHLDEERSRETLLGAVQTFKFQLGATLNDYAAWDDAAENVYTTPDADWVNSNFGDMTFESELFDVAIVLDQDGRPGMAYSDGVSLGKATRGYLPHDVSILFDQVRSGQSGETPQALGFVRTLKGIGAAGVALIRKKSGAVASDPQKRRYLLFIRHMSTETVKRISSAYVLPDLSLAPPSTRSTHSVAIESPSGTRLASLTWTPRAPGDISRDQVEPLVRSALILIAVYCLLLFIIGNSVVRRLRSDEAAAVKLARTDRLSGLANRDGLQVLLEQALQQARSGDGDVVLLYLDLDGFKEVNDAYGHAVGDSLIRAVSAGLEVLVGEDATIARIGGDEFAIVFFGAEAQARAISVAEAILEFFGEPLTLGERVVSVGCSLGLAVSIEGAIDGGELTRQADMAMYASKDGGRGRWTAYHPQMDEERETRNQLALDLRSAIENEEIQVVYQPVVDSATFELVSIEALARWNRRGHGPVSPEIFIPIAETSGLIDRLGLSVLSQSLTQLTNWPGLKLSVNISPGQFRDPAFTGHVADLFRQTGIEPQRVVLEMTETYFIQNAERARTVLERLRKIGVQIALDDFGAGFSSVGYLRQFGFDRMKIDKSLVQSLGEGHKAVEMLQATVALARSLDVPVTAEGVETDQQAVNLRLAGCDQLQGYLFGRPCSPADIDALRLRPMDLRAKAAAIAFGHPPLETSFPR